MKQLWAPWRMAYIQKFRKNGCVFCQALKHMPDGEGNLIVHRAEHAFVILNRYPYTSGHLMVLPFQHAPRLEELTQPARAEMIELVTRACQVLGSIYTPQGFNVGINIGEAAGAGIEEHIHIHIVPRWSGDTNYISTVGEVRVLPETLEESYRRVLAAW